MSLFADSGETIEIQVDQLNEMDHDMSASMLEDIDAQSKSWLRVAQEHLRDGRLETAQKLLENAVKCTYLREHCLWLLLIACPST